MRRAAILLLPALLGACGSLQRLSEVGRAPAMTPSGDPTQEASYRPLTMPMPTPHPAGSPACWR